MSIPPQTLTSKYPHLLTPSPPNTLISQHPTSQDTHLPVPSPTNILPKNTLTSQHPHLPTLSPTKILIYQHSHLPIPYLPTCHLPTLYIPTLYLPTPSYTNTVTCLPPNLPICLYAIPLSCPHTYLPTHSVPHRHLSTLSPVHILTCPDSHLSMPTPSPAHILTYQKHAGHSFQANMHLPIWYLQGTCLQRQITR